MISPIGESQASDGLELELRRLEGVSFVSFGERQGATFVELSVAGPTDTNALRAAALRLALGYLEGPIVIDVVDPPPTSSSRRPELRVQLAVRGPAEGEESVEVHLAYRDRAVATDGIVGDQSSIVDAVLTGLHELGLPVPFETSVISDLSAELGDGTLVVLRDEATGDVRRGLATGRSPEEATARAVLNGLNRYLESRRIEEPSDA